MIYCSKCGKQNEENAQFCNGCGNQINESVNNNVVSQSTEKKGKAIASMVLGIIAIVWAAMELLTLGELEDSVRELELTYYNISLSHYIGFWIGYNLLSLPCGVIGLILGLKSKVDCGQKKAGIITSLIAIAIVVISLVIIISNSNI